MFYLGSNWKRSCRSARWYLLILTMNSGLAMALVMVKMARLLPPPSSLSSAEDDKLCKSWRHWDQNKLYAHTAHTHTLYTHSTHTQLSEQDKDKVMAWFGALAGTDAVRKECKSERLMAKLLAMLVLVKSGQDFSQSGAWERSSHSNVPKRKQGSGDLDKCRDSPSPSPSPPPAPLINLQRLPESQADLDLDLSLASDKPVCQVGRGQHKKAGREGGGGGGASLALPTLRLPQRVRCGHQLVGLGWAMPPDDSLHRLPTRTAMGQWTAGTADCADWGLRLGWAGCLQSVERNSSWQHVANACGRWGKADAGEAEEAARAAATCYNMLHSYDYIDYIAMATWHRSAWTLLSQLQVIRLPSPSPRLCAAAAWLKDWVPGTIKVLLHVACCTRSDNCRSPNLANGAESRDRASASARAGDRPSLVPYELTLWVICTRNWFAPMRVETISQAHKVICCCTCQWIMIDMKSGRRKGRGEEEGKLEGEEKAEQ